MNCVAIFDKNPSLALALSNQLMSDELHQCFGLSTDCKVHQVIEEKKPDLLVIDPAHLDLCHNYDIVDFCEGIRDCSPATKLICYSFDISNAMVSATMEAGFSGCLSKYCPMEQLQLAIKAILAGGFYFDQAYGEMLLAKDANQTENLLSSREEEVLKRFARGHASKQIAFDLEISSKTVDTYKSRAVQKLGLKDRSQIVEYAVENNWI